MTNKIEKKVWPEYFEAILQGKKNYELRLADWECNKGDILLLKEWDPETKSYTGRSLERKVGYIVTTSKVEKFWPKEDIEKYGFQVIGLDPVVLGLDRLIKKIKEFNRDRGWASQPADLAKSTVIEAAELLEHFQWDESDRNTDGIQSKNWEKVGEEVADVFWYLIAFCHQANINLEKALEDKFNKNEKKYPVQMFNGKHNDKFYKEQKQKYRQAKSKA